MAKWVNWIPHQEKMWLEWLESRPDCIKVMCKRYNLRPDVLYRLTPTGEKVRIISFTENGTVSIAVEKRFTPGTIHKRKVSGIHPQDLEECDLPVGLVPEDGAVYLNQTEEGVKNELG